jgi:hypothetical protein
MARVTLSLADLQTLTRLLASVIRSIRRLAVVACVGVAAIAVTLARDGLAASDIVLALVLLVPPGILLVFAAGLREVTGLPERVRSMPQQSVEQLAELSRIASDARTGGVGRAPSLLWRLRRPVNATRGLIGIASSFHIFTPQFLTLALLATAGCMLLALGGLVSLVVLATG